MRDTISLPNNTSDESPAIPTATGMAKASVGFYSAVLKAAALAVAHRHLEPHSCNNLTFNYPQTHKLNAS